MWRVTTQTDTKQDQTEQRRAAQSRTAQTGTGTVQLLRPPDRTALRRLLIVNADDFGRTEGVNRGVVLAHERGIVTSASLMVRWPASDQAAAYAVAHPELSLGIHLDLGEWQSSATGWESVYEIVSLNDAEAIKTEIANQLGRFHKLMGRSPTHIDSHQHVHRSEPVRSVVADFARMLGCPVRGASADVRYRGDFYGQTSNGSPRADGITVASLLSILDDLGPGVTELSCHPGLDADLDGGYSVERGIELRSLCDPQVRQAIDRLGISLVSYPVLRAS